MPDIHDRGRSLAIRMLAPRPKGKGLELVLRKKTVGEYNPETGGQETTWAETDGSGLRTNYSQEDIDDTYILQCDVRILLSPVTLDGSDMPTPSTNDIIVFDTSSYNVINVGPWRYANVTCGFELQCRGL